jgi:hypothetical protein
MVIQLTGKIPFPNVTNLWQTPGIIQQEIKLRAAAAGRRRHLTFIGGIDLPKMAGLEKCNHRPGFDLWSPTWNIKNRRTIAHAGG